MPTPNAPPPIQEKLDNLLRDIGYSAGIRNSPNDQVLRELGELRREVRDLREAICPTPSPLITGREAIALFNQLRR